MSFVLLLCFNHTWPLLPTAVPGVRRRKHHHLCCHQVSVYMNLNNPEILCLACLDKNTTPLPIPRKHGLACLQNHYLSQYLASAPRGPTKPPPPRSQASDGSGRRLKDGASRGHGADEPEVHVTSHGRGGVDGKHDTPSAPAHARITAGTAHRAGRQKLMRRPKKIRDKYHVSHRCAALQFIPRLDYRHCTSKGH